MALRDGKLGELQALAVRNSSALLAAPDFAVMEVADSETTPSGAERYIIRRPTGSTGRFLINGPNSIDPGGTGVGYTGFGKYVLYNRDAPGGVTYTPQFGDMLSPEAGSWRLAQGGSVFTCLGDEQAGPDRVRVAFELGGGGSSNDQPLVLVYNDDGINRTGPIITAIDVPLYLPSEDLALFRLPLKTVRMGFPTPETPFGIAFGDIAAGATGLAATCGIVSVQVTINDVAHQFADVEPTGFQAMSLMYSQDNGRAHILWREDPQSTGIQWCVVRLLGYWPRVSWSGRVSGAISAASWSSTPTGDALTPGTVTVEIADYVPGPPIQWEVPNTDPRTVVALWRSETGYTSEQADGLFVSGEVNHRGQFVVERLDVAAGQLGGIYAVQLTSAASAISGSSLGPGSGTVHEIDWLTGTIGSALPGIVGTLWNFELQTRLAGMFVPAIKVAEESALAWRLCPINRELHGLTGFSSGNDQSIGHDTSGGAEWQNDGTC